MKIFSAAQIREWDAYTIENEPITSVALMLRAARTFAGWWTSQYPDTTRPVVVLAGTGNNGGDGLAVARLLEQAQYDAKVIVCRFSGKTSEDFNAQLSMFPPLPGLQPVTVTSFEAFLAEESCRLEPGTLVIDALFGSGLNRPLLGDWAALVEHLNRLQLDIASVDLPSGLFSDGPTPGDAVVRATRTFSFQTPKRSFFFAENAVYLGDWTFGSIGLHPGFYEKTACDVHYLQGNELHTPLPPRPRFSHKGTFGHALLIAGGFGKMGAAVLASRACLRAGVGLLTTHVPRCGLDILQTAVPEAMVQVDQHEKCWSDRVDCSAYTAVGIGPGIGTSLESARALQALLSDCSVPLVLDADALNILSQNRDLLEALPPGAVLTPHPKEFERLFGKAGDGFERWLLARKAAARYGVYLVLKGAYTAIIAPDGACYFNSTGNPGMAGGGSGDVLTGLLTGLLAQRIPALQACQIAVFLHGLAGDCAAAKWSQPGMTAGDIVSALGEAWRMLEAG